MTRLAVPSLFAIALVTACAGNNLTPQSSNRFSVRSQPTGATVYVMGKEQGTTPLQLTSSQVFPVTYPSELQHKYGRVELRYPGCQPFEKPLSSYIRANGLNATLDCGQVSPSHAAPPAHAAPDQGDTQERLRKLKAIYDEGLITEEEYRLKRQAILQDL